MTIAIYARKSRLSDTGDSVENQIKLCHEYIRLHQPAAVDIRVYQDEGFSGGNTDRPQFQQLQKAVNAGEIRLIVCYRLDRISRNVMDFSAFLDGLQDRNIGFVSLRENFDTTTPMGRAMIYISSVFAQLERETIAERVKDNLFELAKAKRYLAPKPPEGYKKIKVDDGKKQHFELAAQEDEFAKIKEIFNKYLQWRSIHKIQAWSLNEGVSTRRGKYYKCVIIRRILTHPVYCTADKAAYNYFSDLGCQIFSPVEEWTGTFGVHIFRHLDVDKGNKRGAFVREPQEWVIGVGTHPPMIPSADWIRVQEYIQGQKRASVSRPYGARGILSGTLKCGKCGRSMRPVAGVGEKYFYYSCVGKSQSNGGLCDMKNIRGDAIDAEVLSRIREMIESPENGVIENMGKHALEAQKFKDIEGRVSALNALIAENNTLITGFLRRLALTDDDNIAKLITEQIAYLQAENGNTEKEVEKLKKQEQSKDNFALIHDSVEKLLNADGLDVLTKRNLLRCIVNKAVWNGESLALEIFA